MKVYSTDYALKIRVIKDVPFETNIDLGLLTVDITVIRVGL